jgi:maleylacetoacetate isomerase
LTAQTRPRSVELLETKPENMATLYDYHRSSACFRVRIALELKGLAYDKAPVHLVRDGGEQHAAEFRALNPAGLVPVWSDERGVFSQSLAIIEYLEETCPDPPLLPTEPAARAWVRGFALGVACDIHPLNNLRVLQYLSAELGASDEAKNAWYQHWVALGLAAVEEGLAPFDGRLSLGARPGYLEACLIPQLYNARRFNCDLAAYPRILALAARCEPLQAFQQAAPEAQPDAQ